LVTKARLIGLVLLLLGGAVFLWWGLNFERRTPVAMVDFKVIYYGTRCLLEHQDPYNETAFQKVYFTDSVDPSGLKETLRHNVTRYIYLPTAFICILPLAFMTWGLAHVVWISLMASSMIAAALLMWNLAADYAPVVAGLVLCLLLAGSDLLIEVGNAAGIAIALCAIATWCFVRQRFTTFGVVCLAVSLALKPHDSGLVLVFFLLAGSRYRKLAFRTVLWAAAIGLVSVLWISLVAPSWPQELQTNLAAFSAHGDFTDPGPAGVDPRIHGAITISLQTVLSVFRDDPHFYNLSTWIICAPLLLIWLLATFKGPRTSRTTWLALAAISALSMLPIYHKQHDTRLLLLSVPACAMLWAEGGVAGWFALISTAGAAIFTASDALQFLAVFTDRMGWSASGLPGLSLTLLFERPAPLALLLMGTFYLCVLVRYVFSKGNGSGVNAIPVARAI
jgi:hypothetical protein